jgi:hypothetical protein
MTLHFHYTQKSRHQINQDIIPTFLELITSKKNVSLQNQNVLKQYQNVFVQHRPHENKFTQINMGKNLLKHTIRIYCNRQE